MSQKETHAIKGFALILFAFPIIKEERFVSQTKIAQLDHIAILILEDFAKRLFLQEEHAIEQHLVNADLLEFVLDLLARFHTHCL